MHIKKIRTKKMDVHHSRCQSDKDKNYRVGKQKQSGVTLIELIVFMVVSAVISVSLASVFRQAMISLERPTINSQMLDIAHSQLNIVLAQRFDENTPNDGTPCDIVIPCAGFGLDSGENLNNLNGLDDVDDFDGYNDSPRAGFIRSVSVTPYGGQFGIQAQYVKRVDVRVTADNGDTIMLTAYKVNE